MVDVPQVDTLEMTGSWTLPKIRRWKNSQLPVNRLPQEILILVATYLGDYIMLIYLTHVCTHWRRVITACPTFWTRIEFGDEGIGMTTFITNLFLERANGCPLDVHISPPLIPRNIRPKRYIIPTLPPGQQVKTLCIKYSWTAIQKILGNWVDALFPLQVLELDADEPSLASRSTIFVGDALKDLKLRGFAIPGLEYIRTPNLTTFLFSENLQTPCSVKRLFDFLEAAPALEEVSIRVNSLSVHDFPPPSRTLTFPHIRLITLEMNHAPQVSSHLVCPSSTDTRLTNMFPENPAVGIFPESIHQFSERYSVGTIDQVIMRVAERDEYKRCSLQLCSPSGARFKIACQTAWIPEPFPPETDLWAFSVLFDQAVSALLSLPLGNVTTFAMATKYSPSDFAEDVAGIVPRIAEVFEKCPNLREVLLQNYPPRALSVLSRDKTPSIQVLVIKYPWDDLWEELAENIAEVARARHSKGVPFKRIEIFTAEKHPRIELLESWVQEVKYQVQPLQARR